MKHLRDLILTLSLIPIMIVIAILLFMGGLMGMINIMT